MGSKIFKTDKIIGFLPGNKFYIHRFDIISVYLKIVIAILRYIFNLDFIKKTLYYKVNLHIEENMQKKYIFCFLIVYFISNLFAQIDSQEENIYAEKIFYVFEDSKNLYQIASMDLNGDNKQILTKEGNNWCPSVSPKGDLIAFFSDRTGNINLWIMEPDGTSQRQLTFDENSKNKIDLYNRGQISWLKDGDYILFLFNGDIWQIDIYGNNPFSLTSTNDVTMFKLSPDKTKILYSREKTKNHNGLWVMLVDGTNQLQIEKSLIKYPAFDWVTNDKIIFFNNTSIYMALHNGTDRKIVLQTKYLFNEISWSKPESADGYVAFISDEKEGPNIWISDASGKNQKQITQNTGFSPVWYKDGITLFFIEKNDLYKFNINTQAKKRLTYHFKSYYPVIAELKTKKIKQGK